MVQIDVSGQYIYWTDPKMVVGGTADGNEDGVTNKIALVDILSVNHGNDSFINMVCVNIVSCRC